ncbi:MAG: acyl-CoA thioesterase [Nocardioidaceae bacterium]
MRHVYDCPLRWADMDSLRHVNNVVYVDYLQEARVDMFRVHAPGPEAEELAEGVVVVSHELEFVEPLTFRTEPVRIEMWCEEVRAATFRLGYEVLDELPDGGRRVYLRAGSVLAPYSFADHRLRRIRADERSVLEQVSGPRQLEPAPQSPVPNLLREAAAAHTYSCRVRWSDIDSYGHVNNVKYVEYYQEARIALLGELGHGSPDQDVSDSHVVARIDVSYARPVEFRPEPVEVRTWVGRVGRSSYELVAAVCDDATVYSTSRAVLVGFDLATSRPRPLGESERAHLTARAAPPSC